mgnify:FL=1
MPAPREGRVGSTATRAVASGLDLPRLRPADEVDGRELDLPPQLPVNRMHLVADIVTVRELSPAPLEVVVEDRLVAQVTGSAALECTANARRD